MKNSENTLEVKTNGGATYTCNIKNEICFIDVEGTEYEIKLTYFKGVECIRIESSDTDLLNALGVPKRMQKKAVLLKTTRQKARKSMPTVKSNKIDYTQTAKFKNAKSTDLVNSGFGYMVQKCKYKLAQKMGYDYFKNIFIKN